MTRLKFLAAMTVIAAGSVAAFGAAVGANAQTAAPPTLMGEKLFSCGTEVPLVDCLRGTGQSDQGTRTIRIRCNDDGSGTVSWTATGLASGPYNGTFTETGTGSFGPRSPIGSPGLLTNLQVTFHIDSVVPRAEVDGRKFIRVPNFGASGACFDYEDLTSSGSVGGMLRYEAIIKPATGGSYADEGNTFIYVLGRGQRGEDADTSTGWVLEDFYSTLPATRPLLPDAKEQCKDEGFLIFGVFENQGDCVSFVSTHGKNEPGKNNG